MKSTFSHSTKEHREGKYAACESCHTMPTQNWATARKDPYPDVKNYPYHPSCFGCHTKDVYSNGGAFCGTHLRHTESVECGLAAVRAVLLFPSRSHAMQFTTIFPHDIHQNLIAEKTDFGVATGHFIFASFTPTATPTPTPDPGPQFLQLLPICHRSIIADAKILPREQLQMRKLSGSLSLRPTFLCTAANETGHQIRRATQPAVSGFFKDSPDSHASCSLHLALPARVKPAAYDCAGCHKLSEPYLEKKATERYSIKFDHSYKDHANKDCTVCHVRITQNSDVSKMKDADVPFQACSTSSCHGGDIEEEIKRREATIAAKQPAFQCVVIRPLSGGMISRRATGNPEL